MPIIRTDAVPKERFQVGDVVYHHSTISRGKGTIIGYRYKDEHGRTYKERFLVEWEGGAQLWHSEQSIRFKPNKKLIAAQAATQRVAGYHERHRQKANG